jgi:hypothetical protein
VKRREFANQTSDASKKTLRRHALIHQYALQSCTANCGRRVMRSKRRAFIIIRLICKQFTRAHVPRVELPQETVICMLENFQITATRRG